MRKILIATNHSYMLYRFRRELIDELSKTNEVVLSMPFVGHEDDFKSMGYKCIETKINRRGINPKTDLKLLIDYFRLVKNEKPDKVITYSIKPNIYAGLVCRIKKIPCYSNVQGLGTAFQKKGLSSLVTVMYKLALKKTSRVFFENTADANEFIKRRITEQNKITVLNGAGVNLEYFKYSDFCDDGCVHFLFVGRIMKEKGVEELFSSIEKLKTEYGDRVQLDVVGFFEDEYKNIVSELDTRKVINFKGFQTDTRPFYEKCSCVVLPSYHEGMSNVLLEAAAIGRPIITSNIPGCKEAVENGITGYLVKPRNAEDLLAKMKAFVLLDKNDKIRMGLAGREKIKREFDKKNIVKETMTVVLSE